MDEMGLVSELVATYRVLNVRVRTMPEELLLQPGPSGQSPREVVREMRDRELRFSRQLKEWISGVSVTDTPDAELVIGTETEHDATSTLIAQFGTAREASLAALRELPVDRWDEAASGGVTIRGAVTDWVERDRVVLESLLGQIEESGEPPAGPAAVGNGVSDLRP